MEELKKKVNRLENIAWVLGVIAVFLGIGGGFLWTKLAEATTSADKIQAQIDGFQTTVYTAVEEAKKKIDEYASVKASDEVAKLLNPETFQTVHWEDIKPKANWGVYGKEWPNPSYIRDKLGFVHLQGLVNLKNADDANKDNPITVLPDGFQPQELHEFVVACQSVGDSQRPCTLIVRPDGVIYFETAIAGWNSLDGVTFLAAPPKQD